MNRVVLNIAELDGNYRGTAKEVRAGFRDFNPANGSGRACLRTEGHGNSRDMGWSRRRE
jgi:hypothetical protein